MKKGFTLIEMMIVVAIIGILAASLGLGIYQNSLKKSRDGRRKADLENIRSGLEMYRADQGKYPGGSGEASSVLSGPLSGYVSPIPQDPKAGDTYIYSCPGSPCLNYTLTATLEETGGPYTVRNP